jgi:hypothetical protein
MCFLFDRCAVALAHFGAVERDDTARRRHLQPATATGLYSIIWIIWIFTDPTNQGSKYRGDRGAAM